MSNDSDADPLAAGAPGSDGWDADAPAAEPPTVSLTRLEAVAVTAVWPTESRHFTPWLLENADVLSQVLGIDVELDSREFRVGKFSLDLIGKDLSTGDPVIVENQYGATDHNHLGQLLTYAGGTKPSTVVWIAEQFRDEHRAALEWLNTHTDTDVRFFGVRISAVTLKGAPPGLIAPSLELVVAPNDFEKRANAATSGTAGPTSATAELYKQFWSALAPEAKQRGWTNANPPTDNWWSMPTGTSGANWTISYAQFGCRSELFFNSPDPAVNLARWTALDQQKDAIQAAFGEGELTFDDLPNNKGCRIETRLHGPKIANQEQWAQVRAWMLDTQQRLRSAIAAVGGIPTTTGTAAPPPTSPTAAVPVHEADDG